MFFICFVFNCLVVKSCKTQHFDWNQGQIQESGQGASAHSFGLVFLTFLIGYQKRFDLCLNLSIFLGHLLVCAPSPYFTNFWICHWSVCCIAASTVSCSQNHYYQFSFIRSNQILKWQGLSIAFCEGQNYQFVSIHGA